MKLVTFRNKQEDEKIGLYHEGKILDLSFQDEFDIDMLDLLNAGDEMMESVKAINEAFINGNVDDEYISNESDVTLMAPVPRPTSCRDGYAFRQHVRRHVEIVCDMI